MSLALLGMAVPLFAQESEVDQAKPSSQQQFALIASWEGRWQVAETEALQIVFEPSARGKTIVERWETASGLHSITVYHMDGDALIATHYCPQGNQPRLESRGGESGEIRFTFRDVTDLDSGESHTHELLFTSQADGAIIRTEVYMGEDGLEAPGTYTLTRTEP